MEMPGQGFLFIATVLVPENAGTKAQLPKIEVTRKHWDNFFTLEQLKHVSNQYSML
jgi:hypothetical protein